MAVRKTAQKDRSKASKTTSDRRERPSTRRTAARPTATATARLDRGPVDAPGKRHRKPPPQEPIDRQMGEPRGKQMGQKSAKTGRRGGRG
jgi:hypothetical protein